MSEYLVTLHRVNPETNFCDDSGRKSIFYTSSTLSSLQVSCKNNFNKKRLLNPEYDFFDFDKDVYFVTIKNIKTNKEHILV